MEQKEARARVVSVWPEWADEKKLRRVRFCERLISALTLGLFVVSYFWNYGNKDLIIIGWFAVSFPLMVWGMALQRRITEVSHGRA